MRRFTPVGTLVSGEVMPTNALQQPARPASATPPPFPAAAAVAVEEDRESVLEWNPSHALFLSNVLADETIKVFTETDMIIRRNAISNVSKLGILINHPRPIIEDRRVEFESSVARFLERQNSVDPRLRASKDSLARKLVNSIKIHIENGSQEELRQSFCDAYQTWQRQVAVIQGSRVTDAEPAARRWQQDLTSQ
jgi:hypothetical protein